MARKRSARSYGIELVFTLVLIGAIYLFLTNGGPTWFDQLMADTIGAP
jgi:hypothetical protein